MRIVKLLTVGTLAASLLVAPASTASAARWGHREGPVLGLFGAVVGAAAAIATAPFAIVAGAARYAPPPRPYYYAPPPVRYAPPPQPYYYPPAAPYYAQPPAYRQPYGPPQGFPDPYGPPPGYRY